MSTVKNKTVTSVTVGQRDKTRSNVFVDGEFYCSLDNFTVVKNKLAAGVQLSEARLAEIREEGEFASAFDKALSYVSKYRKTKKQVQEYLEQKGYSYPAAFNAVDKLTSYGYLDDGDFARAYAREKSNSKGKKLIALELKVKGVPEKDISEAVGDLNEGETAKRLVEKFMLGKDATDFKVLSKCYRHLLSKGFSYEAASDALTYVKRGDDE